MKSESRAARRLWRQGDLLIQECDVLPNECLPHKGRIIVRGEATGHAHRLAGGRGASLFYPPAGSWSRRQGVRYLRITEAGCVITHTEHGPIPLAPGSYRLWRQREFDAGTGGTRSIGD